MADEENEDKETFRVNIRMSPAQCELMRKLGGALGIDRDTTAAKYFFQVGMQASMGALNSKANDNSQEFMKFMMSMFQDAKNEAENEKKSAA